MISGSRVAERTGERADLASFLRLGRVVLLSIENTVSAWREYSVSGMVFKVWIGFGQGFRSKIIDQRFAGSLGVEQAGFETSTTIKSVLGFWCTEP